MKGMICIAVIGIGYLTYRFLFKNPRTRPIRSLCNKYSQHSSNISLYIGNKNLRLPSHEISSNVMSIEAMGYTPNNIENLALEINSGFVIGFPIRPSDVGYEKIIVDYKTHELVNKVIVFEGDDLISFKTKREPKYVDLDDAASEESLFEE